MKRFRPWIPVLLLPLFAACGEDGPDPVTLDPTPYGFSVPDFPPPPLPADNPLTVAGVELGRLLFHDPRLSGDNTQACADCHRQEDGFSDLRRFSVGIRGEEGTRQAMALVNLAWHTNGFFWDERSETLRDQSLRPIADPLEMDATLPDVIAKLEAVPAYRDAFIRAFGDGAVTAERMGLAMEQFMLTLVSHDSKFDRVRRGEASFTDTEQRGLDLFNREFDPTGTVRGAECFHCHGGFNFTNNQSMNNGLDDAAGMTDPGLQGVTGRPEDRAKFKVPTLRNIAVTPPYMHDGRFATLEEVIDHYDHGVKASATVDPLLQFSIDPGLGLTAQDKADLIAFLETLTDPVFLAEPAFSAPLLP